MRNDSIETLLLRHYGSTGPAPMNLEQRLSATVRADAAAEHARQRAVNTWNERRISRRKLLRLATFSGAGLGILAVGVDTLQGTVRKPAYSL